MLLWLAVPRLWAGLNMVPGNAAVRMAGRTIAVAPEGLERARSSREAARARIDSGRLDSEQGAVALAMAEAATDDVERRAHLRAAHDALVQGLARKPADPFAWLHLAYLGVLETTAPASADRALRLSIETGPAERNLLLHRAAYALLLWRHLSEATRQQMAGQFALALRIEPQAFARLIAALQAEHVVRFSLLDDAEASAALDDALGAAAPATSAADEGGAATPVYFP
jgi:hypothetical protein